MKIKRSEYWLTTECATHANSFIPRAEGSIYLLHHEPAAHVTTFKYDDTGHRGLEVENKYTVKEYVQICLHPFSRRKYDRVYNRIVYSNSRGKYIIFQGTKYYLKHLWML